MSFLQNYKGNILFQILYVKFLKIWKGIKKDHVVHLFINVKMTLLWKYFFKRYRVRICFVFW